VASKPIPLKAPDTSTIWKFIAWFETAEGEVKTNPETGKIRNSKGNWKKAIISELEYIFQNGETSAEMKGYVDRYKKEQMLSPEVQSTLAEAKSNLSPADFSKFAELLEKAKGGVPTA
jgi:hypothetical protein